MAKRFKVTERTIRYDLEEINLFFLQTKIFLFFLKTKDGIITVISNIYERSKAVNLIKGMDLDFGEYTLSPKERKYLILIELFFLQRTLLL